MKSEKKLADVFGVARSVPATYQERDYVDGRFVANLTRDKHLVVFGGSKQGKTCLRKRNLLESDYIVVQCASSSNLEQLYASLLKEAGATIDVGESTTVTGSKKARIGINWLGAGGDVEAQNARARSTQVRSLDIDIGDCNDVIRVLKAMAFSRFIVLEDFHYLSEEVQRQIAVDLKAFHEKSKLCFIVVGVWLEANRLILYNGDLAGRLTPIDADEWKREDLLEIISNGSAMLNVSFDDACKEEVLNAAQGNVGILQEACYRLCGEAGIFETQANLKDVGSADAVRRIVSDLANEQAGRYQNFLTQFAEGLQKTGLEMYRWILHALLKGDPRDLKRGVLATEIFRRIAADHPRGGDLLQNNVLQALKRVSNVQRKHNVQPVILDFDSTGSRLRVVDGGFTLYVFARDTDELRDLIGTRSSAS